MPVMTTFLTLILRLKPGFFMTFELSDSPPSGFCTLISSSSSDAFTLLARISLFMLGALQPSLLSHWLALLVCLPLPTLKFLVKQSRLSDSPCTWLSVDDVFSVWQIELILICEGASTSTRGSEAMLVFNSLPSSFSFSSSFQTLAFFSAFSIFCWRNMPILCTWRVWFLFLSLCGCDWVRLGLKMFLLCHSAQNCSSMSSTILFCLALMPACSFRNRSSFDCRSAISFLSLFMSTILLKGFLFQTSSTDTMMFLPRLQKVSWPQSTSSRLQQSSSLSSTPSAVSEKTWYCKLLGSSFDSCSYMYFWSFSSSSIFSVASYILSPRSLSLYLTTNCWEEFFSGASWLSLEFMWQPHSRVQEWTRPNSLQKTTLPQPSLLKSSKRSLAFMCLREKMHCSKSKLTQFWLSTLGQIWLSTCSMNSQMAFPKMKLPLKAGCACRSRYMNSRLSLPYSSHSFFTAKHEGCFSGSGLLQQRLRFWLSASIRQCPLATPSGLSMGTSTKTKYFLSRWARMSVLLSRNRMMPVMVKLEGVSMGCTLADTKIIGLLALNRTIFWSLKGSPLVASKPSLPSCEEMTTKSRVLPSQVLVRRYCPKKTSLSSLNCSSRAQMSLRHSSWPQGQVKANSTLLTSLLNMKSNFRTSYSSLLRARLATGWGSRLHSLTSPFSYLTRCTGRYMAWRLAWVTRGVPWRIESGPGAPRASPCGCQIRQPRSRTSSWGSPRCRCPGRRWPSRGCSDRRPFAPPAAYCPNRTRC